MAVNSKYTNEQVENLIMQLLTVLENSDAKADLSLMALGNAATSIINNNVSPSQRKHVAASFAKALESSVQVDLH
ncbi:DUF1414 domain-containing protein [Psychrobium sp. 1_MG-2023]|uniref:DUF1414 domain-containing protein n=1 Tax=Psychrobium sp. 1_MG-2023 TaxID=3062624 RepID=UPI000C326596|nr:DUF1414 domain-containing protein [Psychrobium sp. 1_MG-2023]MDP2561718.1 DUF1414 domain-containing protein [Psychrobium sp. 1_MG-2023]PKF57118.1 hypothetical protein CW748_08510 [Alteromonadales bacterium alter-6D02]